MTDFRWPVRIYVEDTDAGGIVFYANYLKYFERARTEWVRYGGVALRGRLEEGIAFVVHSLSMRYYAPAYLDDELEISADLVSATRTSMTFQQEAWRREDSRTLVSAEVRVACVQLPSGRPCRIPDDVNGVVADSLPRQ